DDHGILVARTDYPTETDIDLSRGALVANALSGEPTNGAWLDDRLRRLFEAVAVPLRASANAAPQGVLIAAYAVDDSPAQAIKQATTTDVAFFRPRQRTIGFAVVLGLLLALAAAYVLARQVAGPIRRLALATRQVQDGDYSIAIEARSGDEIGMLSQAFQQLVADLKEKADL